MKLGLEFRGKTLPQENCQICGWIQLLPVYRLVSGSRNFRTPHRSHLGGTSIMAWDNPSDARRETRSTNRWRPLPRTLQPLEIYFAIESRSGQWFWVIPIDSIVDHHFHNNKCILFGYTHFGSLENGHSWCLAGSRASEAKAGRPSAKGHVKPKSGIFFASFQHGPTCSKYNHQINCWGV